MVSGNFSNGAFLLLFCLQKSIYKETDEAKVGIWKLEVLSVFLVTPYILGRFQCWIGSLTWPPF